MPQAALQMLLDAAQQPPPLQELLAHVEPQQPFGELQRDLHSARVPACAPCPQPTSQLFR